jgi:DNA-binding NarL/FixJ family response regulator
MALDVSVSVLSRREIEVAALIGQGMTNRQIADALVIAEGTVANHVVHILSKLVFSSRAQVAVWAAERGLLPDRPRL